MERKESIHALVGALDRSRQSLATLAPPDS